MDSASLKNKGREAREAFGPIDMLFCNAGISMRGLFVDVEDQVDRNILQVDYFGQRTLIKQVLPGTVRSDSEIAKGATIFRNSVHGFLSQINNYLNFFSLNISCGLIITRLCDQELV